jgi:hypothetical protein
MTVRTSLFLQWIRCVPSIKLKKVQLKFFRFYSQSFEVYDVAIIFVDDLLYTLSSFVAR